MAWLQEDAASAPAFGLAVLLATIPGVPFGLIGGIIGAKYGFVQGGIINLAANTAASAIVYFVVRYLLKERAIRWLQQSDKLQRMDHFFRDRVFWSILIARLIPIVPAALINVYAGLFGLPFRAFLLATFLGKIPFIVVYTYIGDSVQAGSSSWLLLLAVYGGFLAVVYAMYRLTLRRGMRG